MAQGQFVFLFLVFLCLSLIGCDEKPMVRENRPNIIYILADDLGFGELGCYGQTKIETPHIDILAKSGMMFNQHYTGSPVCAMNHFTSSLNQIQSVTCCLT